MAKWYVQRGEKQIGPFEDGQLKQLVATGKLKPNDIVRREDRTTGRVASEIKGLFPAAPLDLPDLPPANSQPQAVTPSSLQTPPQASTLQQVKDSAATLTDYAKKQAKLKSLELSEIPGAINELGSKAFEHGVGKDLFSQLHEDISKIDAQVDELRSSKPGKSTDTLTDKVKNASIATVNMAKIELLHRNRKKLVTQLGESVSAGTHVDSQALLSSELQRVRGLTDQRDRLNHEIAEMDMGNKIKDGTKSLYEKRSILRPYVRHPFAITAFLVGCFPIGLFLIWTNKGWTLKRKAKWTAVVCAAIAVLPSFGPPKSALEKESGLSIDRSLEDPKLTPAAVQEGEMLTADFLPAKAGWQWNFSDELYDEVTGQEASKHVVRYKASSPEIIDVEDESIRPVSSKDKDKYQVHRKFSGKAIWLGRTKEDMQPLVFVGARAGDSWQTADGTLYEFSGFHQSSDQIAVITITDKAKATPDGRGDSSYIWQRVLLEKGVGINRMSYIVVTNGRPARSAFRVIERTSTRNIP